MTVTSTEELHTSRNSKENRKEMARLHPVGAQRRSQNRWCLGTGPMVHAPEDPTPTPAVNRRLYIYGLAHGLFLHSMTRSSESDPAAALANWVIQQLLVKLSRKGVLQL